jgi:YbgC/YbaW family acyl-CoA thioester hydrolase
MPAPFVIHDHVRWSDVDHSRIIRYDAYTRFFEVAEAELFRAAGLPLRLLARRDDITFPRKLLHQEYHSPSLLDERLETRVVVSRMGATSLTFSFDIRGEDGRRCADGYMVLVCVDPRTFVKREIPEEVRAALRRWTVEERADG